MANGTFKRLHLRGGDQQQQRIEIEKIIEHLRQRQHGQTATTPPIGARQIADLEIVVGPGIAFGSQARTQLEELLRLQHRSKGPPMHFEKMRKRRIRPIQHRHRRHAQQLPDFVEYLPGPGRRLALARKSQSVATLPAHTNFDACLGHSDVRLRPYGHRAKVEMLDARYRANGGFEDFHNS